jgi:hypothetical protein
MQHHCALAGEAEIGSDRRAVFRLDSVSIFVNFPTSRSYLAARQTKTALAARRGQAERPSQSRPCRFGQSSDPSLGGRRVCSPVPVRTNDWPSAQRKRQGWTGQSKLPVALGWAARARAALAGLEELARGAELHPLVPKRVGVLACRRSIYELITSQPRHPFIGPLAAARR